MKKFLYPIINLVNVVLVSIVFGLGANPAYSVDKAQSIPAQHDWYNLVWQPIMGGRSNTVGIIGFFLFVFAVAGVLFAFIPTKVRQWVNVGVGAALIAAGVLFLLSPAGGLRDATLTVKLSDSLIAMAVLVFIVAAFALAMGILEILKVFDKKETK